MTATERYQVKLTKYKSRLATGTKTVTIGHSKKGGEPGTLVKLGVAGGVRTLGHWNHNPDDALRSASETEKIRDSEWAYSLPDAPRPATTGTTVGTVECRRGPIVDTQYDRIYRLARKNAKQREIAFELQPEDFAAMVRRSAGACELSRWPFAFSSPRHSRNPYGPSIDRIDSKRGYTADNCRLICGALNVAMNVWGLDILLGLTDAVRAAQNGKENGRVRADERAYTAFLAGMFCREVRTHA